MIFNYLFLIPTGHFNLISLNGVMLKDAMIEDIIPLCPHIKDYIVSYLVEGEYRNHGPSVWMNLDEEMMACA